MTDSATILVAFETLRGRRGINVAERVGFEPTIRCRIPLFESGAFVHSATSPHDQSIVGLSPIQGGILRSCTRHISA